MKRKSYALICACVIIFASFSFAGANEYFAGPTGQKGYENLNLGAGDISEPTSSSTAEGTEGETPAGETENPETEEQYNQIDKLNKQISSLKNQQASLQQQIASAQSQKEQKALEKQNIDGQLYNTTQQIQLTQQKIALLHEQIDETGAEIDLISGQIENQYANFKLRLRSTYMAREYGFLGYLFGADSFVDLSVRLETVTRMSAYDSDVIDGLEEKMKELALLQEDLQADIDELESSEAELGSLQSQLGSQSASAQKYISDIAAMEKEFLANTAALQKMQKQMQAEIDAIYANLVSVGEFRGDGTWAWPVPGFSYISSPYGWRFQNTDFHTGMDIAGSGTTIYGAKIVASAAGTVVKVQNNGSSGYGLFCIIDHGGGYTTLYAHTSSITVSVGDEVEKGQTIGYVGNSGWVIPAPSASNPTGGSHLHFEIRINGKDKNPANYL